MNKFWKPPDIANEDSSSVEEREQEYLDVNDGLFSQQKLNDVIRDLNLSKSSVELSTSRLKEKKLLSDSLRITFSRNWDQKFLHFFSPKRRTWYVVQIMPSFCTSLGAYVLCMNPKIGDCSLAIARYHWNVHCCTTATCTPLYLSLTRLRCRRSIKRWSTCWRNFIVSSMSGWFV